MNMFQKSDPKTKEQDAIKRESYRRIQRETYGLNVKQLKQWSKDRMKEELTTELAKQQIAVSKVRTFLDAIATIVRLQSWWRMMKLRRVFFTVIEQRRAVKQLYFRALKIYWRSEKSYSHHVFGKFFLAWRDETSDQKRLQELIQVFFSMCIHRMRLSPQAVMAYFNPGEWSGSISETDKMKIRRLILQRLFNGWRAEARDLKIVRYKASQILSRMMRRTKGPMWVKESALVSFHMWYRYTKVKKAYRLNEPDPRFTNPFLPQWTQLYKEITVNRIKRKRSLETSHKLTQLRTFRSWKYLMTVDRTKPVTPLAVAVNHFNVVLTTKVIQAWFQLIRERGYYTRFRNRIFDVWKAWAPRHRHLRMKNRDAEEWLRLYRQRQSFDVMIEVCRRVVGARTEKIKELRRNFCDRKLVIGAYGLMNMDEHVLMVDCWRKYGHFWRCKRNWKALNAQFTYQWCQYRAKAILHGWRQYTVDQKRKRANTPTAASHQGTLTPEPSIIDANDQNAAELREMLEKLGDAGNGAPKERKYLDDGFLQVSDTLFQAARKHQLPTTLTTEQFIFYCFLFAQTYRRLPHREATDAESRPPTAASTVNNANDGGSGGIKNPMLATLTADNLMSLTNRGSGAMTPSVAMTNGSRRVSDWVWNPQQQATLQRAVDEVHLSNTLTTLSQGAIYEARYVTQVGAHVGDQYLPIFTLLLLGSVAYMAERVVKRDKLKVINEISHPVAALLAASQITRWEKNLLTTRERSSLTQDILVHDAAAGKFRSIYLWRNAVLLFLDVRAEDYARACVSLDEDTRTVEEEVVEVMKRQKIERLISLRHALTLYLGQEPPWTIADRVSAVLPPLVIHVKRRTIFSADSSYNNLADQIGDFNESMSTNDPVLPGTLNTTSIQGNDVHVHHHAPPKNIFTVLREYIFLTGQLAQEARAIRSPLMIRDKKLSVNGFLKQARVDLLALRRERMSQKDKDREAEKAAEKSEKAQKKADKEYAKIKKARQKKKTKRKKALKKKLKKLQKKNKKNGGGNNEDTATMEGDDDDASSDSVGTTNTSMYSSFDERDLEGSEPFVLRELLEGGLSMQEEQDLVDEDAFQLRVSTTKSIVYGETYLPQCWHTDPETCQTFQNRLLKEMKRCLVRILQVVQQEEAFQPMQYQEIKREFNGLGMYLIEKTLERYNVGIPLLWMPLPADYWKFKHVRDRVLYECHRMQAVMAGIQTASKGARSQNHALDDDIEKYQKFLKQSRKQIIQVAEKQRSLHEEEAEVHAGKVQALKKAEQKLVGLKQNIKARKEKLRLAEVWMSQCNFSAIDELLRPKVVEEVEETAKGKNKKKEEALVTFDSVSALIGEAKENLTGLENSIPAVEYKIQLAKADLREFEFRQRRLQKTLKAFAEERFNFMVDVQQLMLRTSKTLDSCEDAYENAQRQRRFTVKYTNQLQYFFDDQITNRGIILTKDAENRKYAELLSRPSTTQNTPAGTPSHHHGHHVTPSTPKMAGHQLNELHDHHAHSPSSGSAGSSRGPMLARTPSRLASPSFPVAMHCSNSNNNRSAGHQSLNVGNNTGQLEDIAEEEAAAAAADLAQYIMQRQQSSLKRDSMDFNSREDGRKNYMYDPTFGSNSRDDFSSAGMLGQDFGIAPDALATGTEEPLDFPDASGLLMAANMMSTGQSITPLPATHLNDRSMNSTRRSIDEQIALMHYNSPENVRKREEELRLLAEQQAHEAEMHDLRMRTFDEYWLAYPRRDVAFENSTTSISSAKTPKRHHHRHNHRQPQPTMSDTNLSGESDDKNQDSKPALNLLHINDMFNEENTHKGPDLNSRAHKMWKSIGDAYWRAKEEEVRELLAQRVDVSGLNPDDIDEMPTRPSKEAAGIEDPLDYELDFLQVPSQQQSQSLSAEDTLIDDPLLIPPAQLALSDQFASLNEELWKVGAATSITQATATGVSTPVDTKRPQRNSTYGAIFPSNGVKSDGTLPTTPSITTTGGTTTTTPVNVPAVKLSVSVKEIAEMEMAASNNPATSLVDATMTTNRRKTNIVVGTSAEGGGEANPTLTPEEHNALYDPFIMLGKAQFQTQKHTFLHRTRMSNEGLDDAFMVEHRVGEAYEQGQLAEELEELRGKPRRSLADLRITSASGTRQHGSRQDDASLSSTAEHSRQVEHYMQMIDQYQKQQPVYQHHSIEEGSDDDDDSDSASQSQAQRSKQGDRSPMTKAISQRSDNSASVVQGKDGRLVVLDDEVDDNNTDGRSHTRKSSTNTSVANSSHMSKANFPTGIAAVGISDANSEARSVGSQLSQDSQTKPTGQAAGIASGASGGGGGQSVVSRSSIGLMDIRKLDAAALQHATTTHGDNNSASSVMSDASSLGLNSLLMNSQQAPPSLKLDIKKSLSTASFSTPTAKKSRAGGARQSFAATTGTEVLHATMRFLNDPSVQDTLSKKPNRQKTASIRAGIAGSVGGSVSGSMVGSLSGASSIVDDGNGHQILEHDAENDPDHEENENLAEKAGEKDGTGLQPGINAIQAALNKVRLDYDKPGGSGEDGAEEDVAGDLPQNLPFRARSIKMRQSSLSSMNAGEDDDHDEKRESSRSNSAYHSNVTGHKKSISGALTGSFSLEENTVALLQQQQFRARKQQQRQSVQLEGGVVMGTDGKGGESSAFPSAQNSRPTTTSAANRAKTPQLEVETTSPRERPQMVFNDSMSQLATPASQHGQEPFSPLRKSLRASGLFEDNSLTFTDTDSRDAGQETNHGINLQPARPFDPVLDISLLDQISQLLQSTQDVISVAGVEKMNAAVKLASSSRPSSPEQPPTTTNVDMDAFRALLMAHDIRPSTTDLREIVQALEDGSNAQDQQQAKKTMPRFRFFPEKFRQNDPDFHTLEAQEVKQKRDLQSIQQHKEAQQLARSPTKHKQQPKADTAKNDGKEGKNAPPIGTLVARKSNSSLSVSSSIPAVTMTISEADEEDDEEDEEDIEGVDKRDNEREETNSLNTGLGPTSKTDLKVSNFDQRRKDRHHAPGAPASFARQASSVRPLPTTNVRANMAAAAEEATRDLSDAIPPPSHQRASDMQQHSPAPKPRRNAKGFENDKGLDDPLSTLGVDGHHLSLSTTNTSPGAGTNTSPSGTKMTPRKVNTTLLPPSLQQQLQQTLPTLASPRTINTLKKEIHRLTQRRIDDISADVAYNESKSSSTTWHPYPGTRLNSAELNHTLATQITQAHQQTQNFYQDVIPSPSDPDYVRIFVRSKPGDSRSSSPQGRFSPGSGALEALMTPEVVTVSEFQRQGSPEFWIGVVATQQRSRTNSFHQAPGGGHGGGGNASTTGSQVSPHAAASPSASDALGGNAIPGEDQYVDYFVDDVDDKSVDKSIHDPREAAKQHLYATARTRSPNTLFEDHHLYPVENLVVDAVRGESASPVGTPLRVPPPVHSKNKQVSNPGLEKIDDVSETKKAHKQSSKAAQTKAKKGTKPSLSMASSASKIMGIKGDNLQALVLSQSTSALVLNNKLPALPLSSTSEKTTHKSGREKRHTPGPNPGKKPILYHPALLQSIVPSLGNSTTNSADALVVSRGSRRLSPRPLSPLPAQQPPAVPPLQRTLTSLEIIQAIAGDADYLPHYDDALVDSTRETTRDHTPMDIAQRVPLQATSLLQQQFVGAAEAERTASSTMANSNAEGAVDDAQSVSHQSFVHSPAAGFTGGLSSNNSMVMGGGSGVDAQDSLFLAVLPPITPSISALPPEDFPTAELSQGSQQLQSAVVSSHPPVQGTQPTQRVAHKDAVSAMAKHYTTAHFLKTQQYQQAAQRLLQDQLHQEHQRNQHQHVTQVQPTNAQIDPPSTLAIQSVPLRITSPPTSHKTNGLKQQETLAQYNHLPPQPQSNPFPMINLDYDGVLDDTPDEVGMESQMPMGFRVQVQHNPHRHEVTDHFSGEEVESIDRDPMVSGNITPMFEEYELDEEEVEADLEAEMRYLFQHDDGEHEYDDFHNGNSGVGFGRQPGGRSQPAGYYTAPSTQIQLQPQAVGSLEHRSKVKPVVVKRVGNLKYAQPRQKAIRSGQQFVHVETNVPMQSRALPLLLSVAPSNNPRTIPGSTKASISRKPAQGSSDTNHINKATVFPPTIQTAQPQRFVQQTQPPSQLPVLSRQTSLSSIESSGNVPLANPATIAVHEAPQVIQRASSFLQQRSLHVVPLTLSQDGSNTQQVIGRLGSFSNSSQAGRLGSFSSQVSAHENLGRLGSPANSLTSRQQLQQPQQINSRRSSMGSPFNRASQPTVQAQQNQQWDDLSEGSNISLLSVNNNAVGTQNNLGIRQAPSGMSSLMAKKAMDLPQSISISAASDF